MKQGSGRLRADPYFISVRVYRGDVRALEKTRAFPAELLRAARRKVLYLHDAAKLSDLRVPPGNRLEALKGRWKGFYSIRINDQWRVVFRFENGNATDVRVDYH